MEQAEREVEEMEAKLGRFTARDKLGIDRDAGRRWFDAARSSDFVTMRDLLEICSNLLWYRGAGTSYGFIGSTALHWAAARGSQKIVLWLLQNGADIDAQNNGGSTPMHSACSNGQPSTLQILLQAGANTSLSDCCGDTPADVAAPDQARQLRAMIKGFTIERTLRCMPREEWTVAHMKQALKVAGVSAAGMTERCELVDAVSEVLAAMPEAQMDSAAYARVRQSVERPAGADDPQNEPLDDDEKEEAAAAALEAKEKGNAAHRLGDSKTAVRWYTLALKLTPRAAALFSNRAASYMSMERFDLALSDAKKAVECDPEWPKGHYRKGCALLQLGEPMEAVWALSTACKLSDPGPTHEMVAALEHAKELAGLGDESSEDETDDAMSGGELPARASSPDPPRTVPRHDWFDCVLCENRTRDYRETTCCGRSLCGTCHTRKAASGCPFACGR